MPAAPVRCGPGYSSRTVVVSSLRRRKNSVTRARARAHTHTHAPLTRAQVSLRLAERYIDAFGRLAKAHTHPPPHPTLPARTHTVASKGRAVEPIRRSGPAPAAEAVWDSGHGRGPTRTCRLGRLRRADSDGLTQTGRLGRADSDGLTRTSRL